MLACFEIMRIVTIFNYVTVDVQPQLSPNQISEHNFGTKS